MVTKKLVSALLGIFVSISVQSVAIGQPVQKGHASRLSAVGFLSGFGTGRLSEKGNYQVVPLYVDFDFRLSKPQPGEENKPVVSFYFVLEPFVSYVSSPDNNAEIGNNFLIKACFLADTSRFRPYVKAGVGGIFITQHIREQGTQLNFNENACLGFHYFFKKNVAFTAEYRYRHLSNADTKRPNRGMDANFGLAGVSYFF
jgi:opacity protein-like surface antigen